MMVNTKDYAKPNASWIYNTNKLEGNDANCINWLFAKAGYNYNTIFVVDKSGVLNSYSLNNYSQGTRPVMYLKSDIKISGGDGSDNSPYVLE